MKRYPDWLILASILTSVPVADVSSHMLTFAQGWSRGVTPGNTLFCLLSYFSARSYVVPLFTYYPIVTLSQALSRLVVIVKLVTRYHELSLLVYFFTYHSCCIIVNVHNFCVSQAFSNFPTFFICSYSTAIPYCMVALLTSSRVVTFCHAL